MIGWSKMKMAHAVPTPPTMGDAHHPFHHSGSFLRVPGKGTKDIRRNEELSPFTVADLGSTAK